MHMSFPTSEAIELLRNWHEDGSWIYMQARSQSGSEHQSWAQVSRISDEEVFFSAEDTLLPVSFAECEFEHIGPEEIPEIVLQRFQETDCCLFLRFDGGAALIYGGKGRPIVH